MSDKDMVEMIGIALILTPFIFFVKWMLEAKDYQTNNRKIPALKAQYDTCLKGTDKKAALDAGRLYYAALRNNKALTIYDEQAIANDLLTMK